MLQAEAHPSSQHIQAMDTTSEASSHRRHQLAQPHDKPQHRGARGPHLYWGVGEKGEKKSPYSEFYKAVFQATAREQALLYCKGIAQRAKSGSSSHRSETGGWEARRQLRRHSEAASPRAKTTRHVPLPEFQQTAVLSNSRCLCSCRALPLSPPAPAAAPPVGHGQVGPSRRAPSPTGVACRAPCTTAAEGKVFGHETRGRPATIRKAVAACGAFLPLLYPCRAHMQAGVPGHLAPPSLAAQEEPTLGTAPLCAPPQPTQNISWLRWGTEPPFSAPSPGQDQGSRRPSHGPHWHHGTRTTG